MQTRINKCMLTYKHTDYFPWRLGFFFFLEHLSQESLFQACGTVKFLDIYRFSMTCYSMLCKFHTFREVHARSLIFSHALLQNLMILVMVTNIKASKDCSKRILIMWPPDLHCILYIALWVYILKNKDPNWGFSQWCHA